MNKKYEKSRIWKKAFSDRNDAIAQKLANEYSAAWDKACSIASQIQFDTPGLTLHDEHHFSALWEAADLLAPLELELNPVETFVFGVAILIHDAAHTTLVYEGGLLALSETPEWADNLVSRLGDDAVDQASTELDNLQEDIKGIVLFDTVRALHAKQASKLLALPFKHPAFETNMYLIEDPTIRNHMGEIIGQIAASHHWNLADLAKLQKSLNVTSPYHIYGPIRPILLAALMRTSDAIQINNSRAPDFEYALTSPSGVSNSHWNAQNKLATGINADDPKTLSINSTASFLEADAPAWWIAYDLAKLADRELRNTDAFLRDYSQPRLNLLGVKDVSDPLRFAKHVKTVDWYPVNAEVKIADSAKLIKLLGGEGLYGQNYIVPLRELIQNAVDAVKARRLFDEDFEGKITVELKNGTNGAGEDGSWLGVTDNGIGMSEGILTGPFITFGESGWSSSTLRKERPGFIGRRFNHIGKFGIGFFSVFMVGDEIRVTSRPFDAAFTDAKLLQFSSGLGLRPLLKDADNSKSSVATSIEVFIHEDVKKQMMHHHDKRMVYEIGSLPIEQPAEDYSMFDLVGMICPANDVEIEAFDSDSAIRASVKGDWVSCDSVAWLCRINGINADKLPKVITENAHLMTLIGDQDNPVGRASLNPVKQGFGVYTVGGMAGKKSANVTSAPNFIGTLGRKPCGPRREPGDNPDQDLVAEWATEQAEIWAKAEISEQEKNFIAANACFFKGNPLPVANAQIDGEWHSIAQIYDRILDEDAVFAPVQPLHDRADGYSLMESINLTSGFLYHPDDIEVERREVMLAGASVDIKGYWSIPTDDMPRSESLLGTLNLFALNRGKKLEIRGAQIDYGYYKGQTVLREYKKRGDRIVLPTIELRLID